MDKYYRILGVNKNASRKEIKKAYYRLVQKYHPDKHMKTSYLGQAEKEFKKINEAYCKLTDPSRFPGNDQGGDYCKRHPDAKASGRCVFCSTPLCEDCYAGFGVVSCRSCFMDYNREYMNHVKIPLINTVIGIILGVILGNLLVFITPISGNLYFSLMFSVYFIGIIWAFETNKYNKKYRGKNYYVMVLLILLFGWIIGFIRALVGFIPSLLTYLKSKKQFL